MTLSKSGYKQLNKHVKLNDRGSIFGGLIPDIDVPSANIQARWIKPDERIRGPGYWYGLSGEYEVYRHGRLIWRTSCVNSLRH